MCSSNIGMTLAQSVLIHLRRLERTVMTCNIGTHNISGFRTSHLPSAVDTSLGMLLVTSEMPA